MKRTLPLVLAALPLAAQAMPVRVQAEFGGYLPLSDDAYGASGASFLSDYGHLDHPSLDAEPVFGLALAALPVDGLEVGVSARRYATTERYTLEAVPEIGQRQETTLYPLLATLALRGGPDAFEFSGGGGAGVALAHVITRGYLDDGEADEAVFCARVFVGGAVLLPLGLDLGGQMAWDFFELPSTHPVLPIEGDRSGTALALLLTLGWQSPAE